MPDPAPDPGTRAAQGRARTPSMNDVARVAGVSHQTVSRVINDSDRVRPETRRRVQGVIEELGYRRNPAARALARSRSGRLGMVASDLALYGPNMTALSVQRAGYDAGYDVALVALDHFSESSLSHAVERLLDQAVEGMVIAVPHRLAHERTARLALPVPVVLVQGVGADTPSAAGTDQVLGARMAVEHLLDLGHRRIAHVTGPLDWIEALHRREGWRTTLDEHDLERGPELTGDWSARSGYAAGSRLVEQAGHVGGRGVTAVFTANDASALGVMRALYERGLRVPEDVSVVGFNDVPESAFYWPPLTTVRQQFASVGHHAVDLMLRRLDGAPSPATELVPPTLVPRATTARTGSRSG